MFGRRFFSGVTLGACAVLAVSGTGVAQGASVPPWRIVHLVGPATSETSLTGVAATGASHAWAVGMQACADPQFCQAYGLVVEQWNGHSWTTMSLPVSLGNARLGLYNPAIGASSPTNVWVFTQGGAAYADHWNGAKWTASVVPGAFTISATYVASTRDVWAFGSGPEINGYAAEYNGSTWVSHPPPVDVLHSNQVSAVNANDIWAAGAPGPGLQGSAIETAHWTGTKWQVVTLASLHLAKNTSLDPFGVGIYAVASNDVWIASDLLGTNGSVLARWNGKTWTRVTLPHGINATGMLTSDGHGGLWMVATLNTGGPKVAMEHYSNGKWSQQTVTPPAGDSLAINAFERIPGTESVWAVGSVARYVGSNYESQGAILKYGS
jgi:hypothetical protein